MFEVGVARTFHALHQLETDDGHDHAEPGQHEHSHDYRAEAVVRGYELDDAGMLLDIDRLTAALAECLAELDAADLDTLPTLAGTPTTVEAVAAHIWEHVRDRIGVTGLESLRVTVHESPEAWAAVDQPLPA